MNGTTSSTEVRALTGLRFFAALLVVVFHFGSSIQAMLPEAGQNIIRSGYHAVGLFFALSGFVLAWNYSGTTIDARTFWSARAARIYPAYLLSLLLALPFALGDAPSFEIGKFAAGAAALLSMTQAWTPWTASLWNPPAWSLSVEAFLYFTFPLMLGRFERLSDRALAAASLTLWAIGMAAACAYLMLFPGEGGWRLGAPGSNIAALNVMKFLPLFHWPEFLLGMAAGVFAKRHAGYPRNLRLLLICEIAVIGAVLANSSRIPYLLLHNGLLAPVYAGLFVTLTLGGNSVLSLLSTPLIHFLGEASYGLYILQAPVSRYFELLASLRTLTGCLLFLALLIAASVLCFVFVEKPLRGRLRRKLLRKQARPAPLEVVSA